MSHKKYRQETNCLNCEAQVTGKFCSNCGQENIETRENFFHLAFHTVGDFFHFDSKFFRTFKPLLTKPGFLTNEHWLGRRMSYLHPLRLFFFITIVMVIIANAYYKKFEHDIVDQNVTISTNSTAETTEEQRQTEERQAKKVKAGIAKSFNEIAIYLKYISFLLLPLYALCFKILYRRSKKFYVDHLVLMLHIQSFVYVLASFLLLAIILFVPAQSREWWPPVLIIATGVYIFLAVKRLFNQSWIKTFIKSVLAMGYMLIVTVLFLSAIILFNSLNVILDK